MKDQETLDVMLRTLVIQSIEAGETLTAKSPIDKIREARDGIESQIKKIKVRISKN